MADINPGCSRAAEYETQFFGFSCHDVFCTVEDTVHSSIRDSAQCLRPMVTKLMRDAKEQAIDDALEAIIKKCIHVAEVPLQRFKEQLSAFFSIPRYVLLDEDKRQREECSQEDLDREKKKFAEFKSRLRRVRGLKALYEAELSTASIMKQHSQLLDDLLQDFEAFGGVAVKNDKSFREFQKKVQDVLGLEVKEASLKLGVGPNCAESEDIYGVSLFKNYKKA